MLSVSKRIDLHHHLPNSSSPIKEEIPTKQGIVTILLRSDCEKNNKFPPSIRRTLSADMSSKKWLQQNGFSSPQKQLTSCSHNNNNNNSFSSESSDEVWRSIQLVNKEKNDTQKTKSSADHDVWGSLVLTQKTTENCVSSLLTPPYVHPLVKRSKSALSEKSLEICTENLGSETGSDGFPSYPSSDAEEEDTEGHKNRILELTKESSNPFDNLHVAKYRVAPSRPIPPPLPSISAAASLHMESRRENGRLVLEAVSVRPKNCFHAQRQDGRLVLTLINSPKENKEEEEEDFANVFDKMEELEEDRDDGYEEEEKNEDNNNVNVEKEVDFFMEQQNARSLPSGIINLHKTGLLMKKLMASKNKSPTSTYYKFNQAVKMMENEEITVVPQSLPPRPPVGRLIASPPPQTVAAAASFNRYEYFWRNMDKVMTTANSIPLKFNYNNRINGTKTDEQHQDEEQQQQQNKAAEEYFVPYLRGCYETKRSVSMWEPYCIATS
ncbi:hypothetical protein ACJIZ3_012130 [Penstemon smallii]|uniref:FAF domain-containing protein n=1 Tax=Penstemon smallii TaxID=265156 RepID=A0ABD3UQF9_9LAMI